MSQNKCRFHNIIDRVSMGTYIHSDMVHITSHIHAQFQICICVNLVCDSPDFIIS